MIAALLAVVALGPQLTRLPNGIPVIVDTGATDVVTLQVLVRTDDLSPAELGAVEVMAGALFGETENYSLRELQRLAWSIGGAVAAESSGDCLRLQISTTKDRLRPTAAFISDSLRRPVFSQASLDEAAQKAALYQKWIDRTPPLREVSASLAKAGTGPLPVLRLTQEQARALHAKVVRPERVAIAVIGDVEADAVASALGGSLGLWNPPPAAQTRSPRTEPHEPTGPFRTALATVKGPKPTDPALAAWMTACIAVAEGKGALLNQAYRVRQPASYVTGSWFSLRSDASYCVFYVSVAGAPPTNLEATLRSYTPTDAEVARAKAYLAGRYRVGGPIAVGKFGAFAIGHENDAARAFWLAWWEMKGAGIGKDAGFITEIEAVTTADVAAAMKTWLD